MATPYNEEEAKAIFEKMGNPDEKVLCPRCGKELQYEEKGNSCRVWRPTEGCIWEICRGL